MRLSFLFIFALFTLALCSKVGALEVYVTDEDGKPVPDVVVTWNLSADNETNTSNRTHYLVSDSPRHLSPLELGVSADGFSHMVLPLNLGQEMLLGATDGRRHVLKLEQVKEREDSNQREALTKTITLETEAYRLDFDATGIYRVHSLLHVDGEAYIYVHEYMFSALSDERGRLNLGPKLIDILKFKIWHPLLGSPANGLTHTWSREQVESHIVKLPVTQVIRSRRIENRFVNLDSDAEHKK